MTGSVGGGPRIGTSLINSRRFRSYGLVIVFVMLMRCGSFFRILVVIGYRQGGQFGKEIVVIPRRRTTDMAATPRRRRRRRRQYHVQGVNPLQGVMHRVLNLINVLN